MRIRRLFFFLLVTGVLCACGGSGSDRDSTLPPEDFAGQWEGSLIVQYLDPFELHSPRFTLFIDQDDRKLSGQWDNSDGDFGTLEGLVYGPDIVVTLKSSFCQNEIITFDGALKTDGSLSIQGTGSRGSCEPSNAAFTIDGSMEKDQ